VFGAPPPSSGTMELSTIFSTNVEKTPYEGPHPRWKNVPSLLADEGGTLAYGRIEEQEKTSSEEFFLEHSDVGDVDSRLAAL